MGKNPAFQFYPSDWQRDLDDHPLEIEGAWIRICCRLFWNDGSSTKTIDEWSRILRKKPRETEKILQYFLSKNICDLLNQNGSITITSRRMVRDAYIRNIRKASGSLGGNPSLKKPKTVSVLLNQTVEQKLTPSSSSSSSKNIKKGGNGSFHPPTLEAVREYCLQRQNMVDHDKFFNYYQSNGWKVGKNPMKDWQAAIRTWEKSEFNTKKEQSW